MRLTRSFPQRPPATAGIRRRSYFVGVAIALQPAAVGCSKQRNDGATVAARASSSVLPSAPVASAPPAASALPSPPASASAAAPAKEVSCGSSRCSVGREKCCLAPSPQCVPRGMRHEYCEQGGGALNCDDSNDCDAGMKCCWDYADSETKYASCSPRCGMTEACTSDATCEQGFACLGASGKPGACSKKADKKCGSATCEGATPICCWSTSVKQAKCVARAPTIGDECVTLSCTASSDCGSNARCCYRGASGETTCRGDCYPFNEATVCERPSDCAPKAGTGALVGCLPVGSNTEGHPAWIKRCVYDGP